MLVGQRRCSLFDGGSLHGGTEIHDIADHRAKQKANRRNHLEIDESFQSKPPDLTQVADLGNAGDDDQGKSAAVC